MNIWRVLKGSGKKMKIVEENKVVRLAGGSSCAMWR